MLKKYWFVYIKAKWLLGNKRDHCVARSGKQTRSSQTLWGERIRTTLNSILQQNMNCGITTSTLYHYISGTDRFTFGLDTLFISAVSGLRPHRGRVAFLKTVTW